MAAFTKRARMVAFDWIFLSLLTTVMAALVAIFCSAVNTWVHPELMPILDVEKWQPIGVGLFAFALFLLVFRQVSFLRANPLPLVLTFFAARTVGRPHVVQRSPRYRQICFTLTAYTLCTGWFASSISLCLRNKAFVHVNSNVTPRRFAVERMSARAASGLTHIDEALMRWIVVLSSILALGFAAKADVVLEQSLENAADCAEVKQLEVEIRHRLPLRIDDATFLNNLSVDCSAKTVTYTKRLLVDPARFREGWIAREQRHHTDLHCQSGGLANASGWTAKDTLLGPDFRHVVTLATRPSDCRTG